MSRTSSEGNTYENIEYKVIVYITKGKIIIQGAKYSIWCQEEFNETLKMVNDMSQTGSSSILSPVRDTHMVASASASLDDSVTLKNRNLL